MRRRPDRRHLGRPGCPQAHHRGPGPRVHGQAVRPGRPGAHGRPVRTAHQRQSLIGRGSNRLPSSARDELHLALAEAEQQRQFARLDQPIATLRLAVQPHAALANLSLGLAE